MAVVMGVLTENRHMVAKGRMRPHHRTESEDRSSGVGSFPRALFPATGGCRRAAQPLNPFVKIKPFVHSEVCFHKSFFLP